MLALIGNIIWICTGGWVTALWWLVAGIICYVTILGIPLGRQCMKMATLTLVPFGRTVVYGGGAPSLLANLIWLLIAGIWMSIIYLLAGLAFCVTVVGIPFGVQLFKMAKLALCPFGAEVR